MLLTLIGIAFLFVGLVTFKIVPFWVGGLG